jgi:hypothetical protein
MRRLALAILACTYGEAADWTVYRMGPFEVYTDRDPAAARETLNQLEQLRWAFGYFTGKDEPKLTFPVRVVLSGKSTSPRLEPVSDGWRGYLGPKQDISREWSAQIVRLLIESNLGRMPQAIEDGLVAVLSTAEVSGTHVIIGQPPKQQDLDWARLHLLITSDEYRGRVRVYVANLEKGVELDVASRNALGKTAAQIDELAKAHLAANVVPTFDLSGKPLNPRRDFTPRVPDEEVLRRVLAETSHPDTAMGKFAAGDFEAAMKLQPEWAEPYREAAKREKDPGRKAGLLKKAAELSPRDYALSVEFAELMTAYERWLDADKAWAQALRAASNAGEREAVHARRRELTEKRLEAEENARREARLAEEREIQRLKNEAIARIQEAERKANEGKALDPNAKIHDWWDGPQPDAKLTGTLVRVDCRSGRFSLAIQSDSKLVTLTVPDPKALVVTGGESATLDCGIQKPARPVEVEYFEKTKQAAVIRYR